MNIDFEISNQQRILKELHQLRVIMEKQGYPQDAPVFGAIIERSWKAISHWETFAYLDPENRYYIGRSSNIRLIW